jgi:peptidoglycan/LPS O-acetylase OafA/YrhL
MRISQIDGLRFIAVMFVVLYHGSESIFPGGFRGVDIFFVISGFVVTKSIIESRNLQKFSLSSFYLRRLERLGPSFLSTSVICALIVFIVRPHAFFDSIGDFFWALLFSSNLFFWQQLDYFAYSSPRLFLHYWSLSLEEQFYFFLPISLLVIYRFKIRTILKILSLIIAISFFGSMYFEDSSPVAVFFLLPFRVWELLAGSLCFFICTIPASKKVFSIALRLKFLSPYLLIFLTGTLLIGEEFYSATLINASVVVIASLLIVTFCLPKPSNFGVEGDGDKSIQISVDRLLNSRIFQHFGMCSYQIYLWHYPIKYFLGLNSFSLLDFFSYLFLSLLIAGLFYTYVDPLLRIFFAKYK